MTKKLCRDCRHFKDGFLMGGLGWCSLNGSVSGLNDFCKLADGDIESWRRENTVKDLRKTILYIERLLKEVEDTEWQNEKKTL